MHTNKAHRRFNSHTSYGAALAEGIAAIALIVFISIAFVFFVVDSGMSIYYKEKLGFITNQTAAAIAALNLDPTDPNSATTAQSTAQTDIKNLVTALNLPLPSNVSVDLSKPPIVSVTVQMDGLPLLQGNVVLPTVISLTDTGVALQTQPQSFSGFLKIAGIPGAIGWDKGSGLVPAAPTQAIYLPVMSSIANAPSGKPIYGLGSVVHPISDAQVVSAAPGAGGSVDAIVKPADDSQPTNLPTSVPPNQPLNGIFAGGFAGVGKSDPTGGLGVLIGSQQVDFTP